MSQKKDESGADLGARGSAADEARLSLEMSHIQSLVELMVAHDLSRLELRNGQTHILLRRGQPVIAAGLAAAPVPAQTPPAAHATGAQPPRGPVPAEGEIFIRAPMVGTFYASPEPDAPPFVSSGAIVTPDTIVGLLEAMKVFNEIKAECAGRITRVLVKNAQAVEFDQPLFAVVPG